MDNRSSQQAARTVAQWHSGNKLSPLALFQDGPIHRRTGMMEHLPKIRLNLPSIFNWEIDVEAWLLFTSVSASFQRYAIRKEQIGALEQIWPVPVSQKIFDRYLYLTYHQILDM